MCFSTPKSGVCWIRRLSSWIPPITCTVSLQVGIEHPYEMSSLRSGLYSGLASICTGVLEFDLDVLSSGFVNPCLLVMLFLCVSPYQYGIRTKVARVYSCTICKSLMWRPSRGSDWRFHHSMVSEGFGHSQEEFWSAISRPEEDRGPRAAAF